MIRLVELGWGERSSAFLQMFTSQFFPEATPEQARAFNEIQRRSTSPARAARLMRGFAELDASQYLAGVRAPTPVLHCRGDSRVPFEHGRRITTQIAGARFEPLASNNHVPLAGEPAFGAALDAIVRFAGAAAPGAPADLSARERQHLRDLPVADFLHQRRAAALQLRLESLARGRASLVRAVRRAWRVLRRAAAIQRERSAA